MKATTMNGQDLVTERALKDLDVALPGGKEDRTASFLDSVRLREYVSEAVKKTHTYYLNQQHPDGYWWYELESNVTITSEYLMLLDFLGLRDEKTDRKIIMHILKQQRSDGTWSLYRGGKGDVSATVEAYFALKLAGLSPAAEPLKKARMFILKEGGVEAARVFTKIYLAIFGQFPWKAIPAIPVEINLLPAWCPFNIYSFSSWARTTIVPLTVLLEFKPAKNLPDKAGIRELYSKPDNVPPITTDVLSPLSWKKIFLILDRVLKAAERMHLRPFREKALKKTERWILDHQEPEGDWGGIQPPMVNSIFALATLGYSATSEPVRKGLEALRRFTIETDDELTLQACVSPVWDTALTAVGLVYSGLEREHPSFAKACTWLASKQIFQKGDWSIKRPRLEPAGWAFEFENNWYPDVDDTALILFFLNRFAQTNFVKSENLDKGLRWLLGMQGKDGGWGAFDVDNNLRILNQLPFGDLEAMIDPSTPDITGRVLELLGSLGYGPPSRVVRRALKFIRRNQEESGSWWGRWGVNYLYGTCTVLSGLASVGEDMSRPYIRKAVTWLKSSQNRDGGWGESCETYDGLCSESANSTASQTAWALLALIAAGEAASEEVLKGISYLLERQKADGTWDEEEYTGTGFPRHFFIRYHNYRNCFPLMALGRFLYRGAGEERTK